MLRIKPWNYDTLLWAKLGSHFIGTEKTNKNDLQKCLKMYDNISQNI